MLLKKYKKGGKVKGKTHREIALGVYKKQMEGKPLVGYEKEYSKSGSYRAFQKTKPYDEVGHLKVTGQTGDAPKPKRLDTEFGRSAGASPLAKAKAHIKKKRKAKDKDKEEIQRPMWLDVPTPYKKGGKVLQKQSGRRKRKWGIEPGTSKLHTLEKGREFRKGLEGAPDLEDDLWAKYQKKGYLVLPQLVEEQRARDAKVKAKKMEKTGLKMPKAAGGSLPLGEGGKKKKKTTNMPHGAMMKERGVVFKGKKQIKPKYKKAQLLKK